MAKVKRICSIENCNRPHMGLGFCGMHRSRLKRHGDPLKTIGAPEGAALEFLRNLPLTDECIEWPFHRCHDNYGHVYLNQKTTTSHRASYILNVGEVDPKIVVRHQCDNPPCVNPRHLLLGTHADNAHDRDSRGRANSVQGVRAGSAKLVDQDVIEIIQHLKDGISWSNLAKMYGIRKGSIGHIASGRNWKHIPR